MGLVSNNVLLPDILTFILFTFPFSIDQYVAAQQDDHRGKPFHYKNIYIAEADGTRAGLMELQYHQTVKYCKKLSFADFAIFKNNIVESAPTANIGTRRIF